MHLVKFFQSFTKTGGDNILLISNDLNSEFHVSGLLKNFSPGAEIGQKEHVVHQKHCISVLPSSTNRYSI